MNLRLKRSEILLIAGFWLVGCALLSIVFYYALQQGQPPESLTLSNQGTYVPQAAHTLEHTRVTARSLEDLATSKALSWNSDAALVGVVSNWEEARLGSVGQPSAWTYRYYSPSNRRVFFVTVTPEGDVTGTSHAERIYSAPHIIDREGWQVDSATAVNIWINHTGAEMLNRLSDNLVVAKLATPRQNEPLTWTVSGYDLVTKNYHTIFINAATGEIMNIKSTLR